MKIQRADKTMRFDALPIGAAFTPLMSDEICLKVRPNKHLIDINAVRLRDGQLMHFLIQDRITPIDGCFIEK